MLGCRLLIELRSSRRAGKVVTLLLLDFSSLGYLMSPEHRRDHLSYPDLNQHKLIA